MKLTGYSVVWRPPQETEWRFASDMFFDGTVVKAPVFEHRDEALCFLASLGLSEQDEAEIVEVTLNTRGFKGE